MIDPMRDLNEYIRVLEGADFPVDNPEPKVSGLWLTIGGLALFAGIAAAIGWWFWG